MAVPFGKSNERLRLVTAFADTRTEIKKPGPRRSLIELQSVIVAAGIIAIPNKPLGRKAILPQPFAK